ncbi:MAG TPA: hypothetical protein VGV15_17410 [Terriglobales bacterium]|nr:hypothetical protein [Terriglobales bacterium]
MAIPGTHGAFTSAPPHYITTPGELRHETAPLEEAADAYARMMDGKARFRMVLVTKNAAPV